MSIHEEIVQLKEQLAERERCFDRISKAKTDLIIENTALKERVKELEVKG
jgi:hypothetical protein